MNINSSLKKTPIAVIGLSAMFADAKNIEEYWTNIIQSIDSIKDVPANRWLIDDYYDEDMMAPDKTYCKRGGFLPEIDFNPMEFGLPPNILEVTDASQLLGLVAARDAFEDAGYGRNSAKFTKELKEKTGVLLGVGGGQKLITPLISRLQYPIWERALRASGVAEKDIPNIVAKMKSAYVGWNENSFPGLLGNVISGRITNRFDLGGINSVVDAACAASLSAIKMSLSELVEGRCDMMLTGGVDTDNSPFMYMSFSKTPAFSKSGNISPFSEQADGMLIGEGLGMLVLKRLADAERDGDRIYSVIKGVGTSSDGRFKSVYAPRPSGQALAMNRAYEDAGYAAASVGLLETHGTGTVAGDLAEFTSMQMVFGADNPQKQNIALGSVKSQIGHTKAAAGSAGIIKAVLALHHKVLPPTINVAEPRTELNIKDSAIYINTEARPWLQNGHPRRTGVSAFGFGGINVHITMEEYLGARNKEYRLHEPNKSIILQAVNPSQLLKVANENLALLNGPECETAFKELVSRSKEITIPQQNARLGFVANSKQECIKIIEDAISRGFDSNTWNHPTGVYYRASGIDVKTNKVAALFAGQGSQYVGMGKELANAFPSVAQTFELVDQLYQSSTPNALSKKIFPIPVFSKEEKVQQQLELTKTQFAQPAIGALSMAQFKVLQEGGFSPHFTAGHSFGELTALWAAGVYDDTTFLNLAKTRGEAMAINNPAEDSGTMLAVKAGEQEVIEAIKNITGVSIANVNSNKQVVLGGSTSAIKIAEEQLKVNGFSVVPLRVAAAFHTDFVKHAQLPFSKFVDQQVFNSPKIPVYSNTSGNVYPSDLIDLKSVLKNQILNPVLFKNQIENLYSAGARVFVEFGPKGILTNLVANILEGKEHYTIAINASAKKDSDLLFRQAAVQMQVLGLDLSNIDPYKKGITPLPEKSKLTVALSGNNFVSSNTQKAYHDIMRDGFQISGGETKVVEKVIEKIITVEKIVETPIQNNIQMQSENEEEIMNKEVVQLLKNTLDSFRANQTKSLEIFERYMNEQNEQSLSLVNIITQHLSEGNGNAIQTPILSNAINLAVPMNSNGSNGANGISTAIKSNGISKNAVLSNTVSASHVLSTTVNSSKNGTSVDSNKLTSLLLEVVSEKTGYPAEMLELSMDMEADLGIDSIKRVEIFGALTKQHPEMSGINPSELTELRTLAEIVDFVSGNISGNTDVNPVVSAPSVVVPIVEESKTSSNGVQTSSNGNGANYSQLKSALLQVVSEKTGYPAEMLELNMDMEADLGIDSIKRVEIFGALTKQHPEMSGINPTELTELRTLAEIVDFVSGNINGDANANPVVSTPSVVAPVVEESKTSSNGVQASSNGNGVDPSLLKSALLQVVSEKTGYPAEMLELNMDMEADLGIDSIKRVEIFGALTKQHPEMSGINPTELTELRTLAEIVDFVSGSISGNTDSNPVVSTLSAVAPVVEESKNSSNGVQASSNGNGVDPSLLKSALLQVVSEKTGYPAEMLELNMDMEADLGIDSIKRVEIFGALTKQHPEMSGINPTELTELRTLAEIVDFVSGNINGNTDSNPVVSTPNVVAPVVEESKTSSNGVQASSNGNGVDPSLLKSALLQVVSEKTGYPAEMLELNMDMEADLGIDSIKRVEIFGALTKQHPEMSGINPTELTELRTLAEIVDFVSGNINGNTDANPVVSAPSVAAPVKGASVAASNGVQAASNGNGVDPSLLKSALLQVVSEKTGYPAEMLELNMDMEADLGIDSIKRVEIFGALTKQHPEMSGINPTELTELRTLAEIVDFVSGNINGNTDANSVDSAPSVAAPIASAVTSNGVQASSNGNGVDSSLLKSALLQVVSEKTGYPAEMLELNMDMEADLGIDSIKRVEIFGALTKQHPEMSGINPTELTELRTLAEIVDYVSVNSKKKSDGIGSSENDLVAVMPPNQGMVQTGAFHAVKRFEIGLKYLPQPDLLEFSMPASHVILLTNDGTELTPRVIAALEEKGNRVVSLNLKGIKQPIGENAISLLDSSDQQIGIAIQKVQEKYGKIGSFIHLHPHFEFQKPNFTEHFTAEKEIVKTMFFIAKHIQKDLNELGKEQRVNFLSCTRMDGKLGQGKRGNTSVIGGGITGLVKCLNLEWSPVFCRAIDIQPELSTEQIVNQLMAEYQDADVSLVEVAFSEEGRRTTVAIPTEVIENQWISTTVNSDSVFLVSGGARGVTASCVIEMAKTFQCKFILLGRSNMGFEIPQYARNENDEATLKRLIMNDMKAKGEKVSLPKVKSIYKNIVAKKEIDKTISVIQNHGAEVIYVQGDVTDISSFKADLSLASAQLGKVTGIIHGAGRLADKYIQDKTESDFKNVLSVKLDGMLTLLGAVDIYQLDHLILFSSVAGFYGNIGQTDYAIANEILSKAAHLFRTNHPNTQVTAINWGAWDSGMVSGELKAQFEAAGISLVNSDGGAAMLVNELNKEYANQPQVIIGGTLPAAVSYLGELKSYRIHRELKLENNPFLNHHKIQNTPVLPVVNAIGWMAQSCEKLYPDFAVHKVENTALFKGIVFDGKQEESYVLEIKELEKGEERIVFETTVFTEGKKMPTNHYRATITLLNKRSFPSPPKFSHQLSGIYQARDGKLLYQERTLFHAPYFQGIKEILDCNDKQIVLSCVANEVPLSEQGQFPINSINTFFADIQYQGMLVWVHENYNGAKGLPLQTDSAIMYRPIPFGKKLFVNIKVQEADDVKLIADCTVYDEQGMVYIETLGACITISSQLVW